MWPVETTDVFDEWFTDLNDDAQAEVIATVELLKLLGPRLGRPGERANRGIELNRNAEEILARLNDVRAEGTGIGRDAWHSQLLVDVNKWVIQKVGLHQRAHGRLVAPCNRIERVAVLDRILAVERSGGNGVWRDRARDRHRRQRARRS